MWQVLEDSLGILRYWTLPTLIPGAEMPSHLNLLTPKATGKPVERTDGPEGKTSLNNRVDCSVSYLLDHGSQGD